MNVSLENFITVVFLAKQVQKRFGKSVNSFQTQKKSENTESTSKNVCRSAKVAVCIDEASSWWLRVFPSPRSLHFESSVTRFVLNFLWEKKVCVWENRNAAAEFVSSNSWTFKKITRLSSETLIFSVVVFLFLFLFVDMVHCGKFCFLKSESLKLCGTHLLLFSVDGSLCLTRTAPVWLVSS